MGNKPSTNKSAMENPITKNKIRCPLCLIYNCFSFATIGYCKNCGKNISSHDDHYCNNCSCLLKKCYSCGDDIKSGSEYIDKIIEMDNEYRNRYGDRKTDSLYDDKLDIILKKYRDKSTNEMIKICIEN